MTHMPTTRLKVHNHTPHVESSIGGKIMQKFRKKTFAEVFLHKNAQCASSLQKVAGGMSP